MNQPVSDILKEIEALPENQREQLLEVLHAKYARAFMKGEGYTFWCHGPDGMFEHIHEEEQGMNMDSSLKEANRRVDQVLPDLWAKAEQNLIEAEAEYQRKKGEK